MYVIKNAKIVTRENETKIQDLLIEEGKIKRIADHIIASEKVYDACYQLVLPGGIDVHVHLREPGFSHKETICSGSKAAAKGGYTTIMAMPNVLPYPDHVEVVKQYQKKLQEDAVVNVIPYACITVQEKGKELVDMKALKEQCGIYAFSDDGVGVQNDSIMKDALQMAYEQDVMLVAHTEDMRFRKPKACVHEGSNAKRHDWVGIPSECEWVAVERDLQLALEMKAAYHICHMSTKESVALLRKYKALGANVSGEVTTHHLLLNEDSVVDPNYKMNPPLRSKEDQEALIQGLLDGIIDFVANDHAPHTEEEKSVAMDKAPFGVVALETSIPLLYTHFVKQGKMSLEMFQNVISSYPAKRFGFSTKGCLAEGYDADLIVLSDECRKIEKKKFVSMGKNTPFEGVECQGFVCMTMVNGNIVYEEGGKAK